MKTATALLLLAALAAALQIGQLQFTDVKSQQDLAAALGRDGPVLIFIHQPNCQGCLYLKTQVFPDGRVASALRGVNLVSIDLADYFLRGVEAVADGRIYIYYGGSLREQKASGRQNIPVIGTPTVVMGYVNDGVLHVTFVMIGAADPDTFLKFLDMAYGQQTSTPQQQTQQPAAREGAQAFAQIALSFAALRPAGFDNCGDHLPR